MLSAISRFGAKGMVSMPDLSGLTVANARSAILSAGLKVGSLSSTSSSSSSNQDRVSAQAIAAGTLIDYETSVNFQYYVYVAPPPSEPTAPYIIGYTYGDCINNGSSYTQDDLTTCNSSTYCFDRITTQPRHKEILDTWSDGRTPTSRNPKEYEACDATTSTQQVCKVVGNCGWEGSTTPTITCSNYDTSCSNNQYQTRRKCVDSSGATVSDTLVATYACGCTTSETSCDSNGWKISYYTCYNPDGSTYGGSSAVSCTSCGGWTWSACLSGQKTGSKTCYTGGVANTIYDYVSCCTPSCGDRYYFACSNGQRHWTQICVQEDCSEERVSGDDPCCYGQCGSWGPKTYVYTRVYTQSRTCIDASCNTYTDTRTMCDPYCGSWTDTSACLTSPYGRYKNQKRTCVDAFCDTYTETRSVSC